jgi:hypothetical protein
VARFRFWIHGDLLLRYDGEMAGFPRGAALGPDGRWRPYEGPDRNVWRGSDYGQEVSARQAGRFLVAHGHDVALLEGGELHPVAQWPQARTVINVALTRKSVAMGDDAFAPHDWSFQVNSITMLGELVQIILATSYLSTTGTPGTWIVETASRPASPLAVITYPRSGERWLADPAQYLIQMRDIYDAATETAALHVGHPFTHDPDAVFAQMTARVGGPVPRHEFTGNTAAREQPPRPRPPW